MSRTASVDNPAIPKLLGLELIRFVCAFAVLVWHYDHFAFVGYAAVDFVKPNQPFYRELRLFYEAGLDGVQVFWCVSGFIFFWKYETLLAARTLAGGKFFVLRFSRLYPLHVATLLLVLCLQSAYYARHATFFVYRYNDWPHFIAQVFMASDWGLVHGLSFNGPIWSISVEVLVYLLFFLTARFCGTSLWVNLAVLLVYGGSKWAGVASPVLYCIAFFYLGGLSAKLLRYARPTRVGPWLAAAAGALSLSAPLIVYALGLYQRPSFVFWFTLAYTPVLVYWAAGELRIGPRAQRLVEAAGNMTYSSYLAHFPLQLSAVLCFGWARMSIPTTNPLFFVSYLSLTLLLSWCIFRYFEMPAQSALRSRLM